MNTKSLLKMTSLWLFILLIAAGCNFQSASTEIENTTGSESASAPDTTESEEPATEGATEPTSQQDPETTTYSRPITGTSVVRPVVPQSPLPPKTQEDKETEKYIAELTEIAKGAETYYNDYFSKTRLITRNGKLYNYSTSQYVTADYLSARNFLEEDYKEIDCSILLLKPGDLWEIGIDAGSAGNDLTILVAAKSLYSETFLICTKSGLAGTLSTLKYINLIGKYTQGHGDVKRIFPGDSEEYGRILNFIRMYESVYQDYYVRGMYLDNKYASVILSPKNNTSDIRHYILKKTGTIWEVALSGLEDDPRVAVTVNKSLPDFNVNMLPSYTINDYRGSLKISYSKAVDALSAAGHITSSADISYLCGAGDYCYIVTAKGGRYLIMNNGSAWEVTPVENQWNAAYRMMQKSASAPVFIICDE